MAPIDSVHALEQTPWLEHGWVGELTITEVSSGVVRPYQPNPCKARIRADNSSVLQAFALTGQGVAILPDWLIEEGFAHGAAGTSAARMATEPPGGVRALPRYTAFAAEGAGVYRFYEGVCIGQCYHP